MRRQFLSILAPLLIVASCVLFFHKVLFFGHSFLGSLIVAQGVTGSPPAAAKRADVKDYPYLDAEAAAYIVEPATILAGERYRQRHPALWNPHVGMGAPLLADLQSGLLFPLKIPLFIDSSPLIWGLYFVLRIMIAGMLMYLYCRKLEFSREASLAASFVFMWGGHFVLYIHIHHLDADILVPLVLLSVEHLVRKNSAASVLATGCVFALVQLGGTPPEASFAVAFFATAYFLFRVLSVSDFRKESFRLVRSFSLAALIGVLISLPVIMPFMEFLRNAYHAHHVGQFCVQPTEFILLFIPFFVGEHNFVMPYIGVIAPTLALIALARGPDRKLLIFFWCFMLFYLTKAFGVFGTQWIGLLPLFRLTNFPKYFHSSFLCSLAVCAAAGFDAVVTRRGTWRAEAVALVPIPVFIVAFCWTHFARIEAIGRTSIALTQTGSALLIVAILAALFLLSRNERVRGSVVKILLCVAVFGELLFYSQPLDYPRRTDPFPDAPYLRFLRQDDSVFRVFSLQGVLPPNYSSLKGLSDIGINNAIFISRYVSLMRAAINSASGPSKPVNEGRPNIHSRMLDLFNVKYLITKTYAPVSRPRFKLVYDAEVKIYQNLHCMPRAFIVHKWEVIEDESQVLRRILSDTFDAGRTAVLEERPDQHATDAGASADAVPDAVPRILRYEPEEVVISASPTTGGLLVLTDSFFPGWNATVDGQNAKILRADYFFRAVYLSPGEHTVRFTYRPMSFWIPLMISVATLLGIAGFLAWRAIVRFR